MASSAYGAKGATRQAAIALALALFFVVLLTMGDTARAQTLTVFPVNIQLLSGQRAATLTVINQGTAETSIQVRAYSWSQRDGDDQLTTSDAILVSPPIATIAPGAKQIIRLVLRRLPERGEDSYRILLDQLPQPPEAGVINVVLRMSIPIFAAPKSGLPLHVQFHLEQDAKELYLVAVNNGVLHEVLHGMDLWTEDGVRLKNDFSGSPYILAGVTRRWPIGAQTPALRTYHGLSLKASGLTGPIDQQVHLVGIP